MLGRIPLLALYVLVGVCQAVTRCINKEMDLDLTALSLVCSSRGYKRTSQALPAVFRSLRRRRSVWRGVFFAVAFAAAAAAAAGVIKRSEKPSGAWTPPPRRPKEGSDRQQMDAEELVGGG